MYLFIHITEVVDTDQDPVALSFLLMPGYATELPPVSTNLSGSYSSVTPLKSRLQTFIS